MVHCLIYIGREYIFQGIGFRSCGYILLPDGWAGIYWTLVDIKIYLADYAPSVRFQLPYRTYYWSLGERSRRVVLWHVRPIITGVQPVIFSPVQKMYWVIKLQKGPILHQSYFRSSEYGEGWTLAIILVIWLDWTFRINPHVLTPKII